MVQIYLSLSIKYLVIAMATKQTQMKKNKIKITLLISAV